MIMNGLAAVVNQGITINLNGLKAEPEKQENHKSFKDILSSNTNQDVKETRGRQPLNSIQKSVKVEEAQDVNPTEKKIFRQLVKEIKKAVKESELQDKTNVSSDNSEVDTDIVSQKAEIIAESLAQVIGIKPEDMNKLLESAGIKPEELAGTSTPEEISSKLSAVLGLDKNLEHTLTNLLKVIDTKVDSALSKVPQNTENPVVDSDEHTRQNIKFDVKIKVDDDKGNSSIKIKISDLDGLSESLKIKLKEISTAIDNGQTSILEKVTEAIQPILQKIQTQTQTQAQTNQANSLEIDGTTAVDSESADLNVQELNSKEENQKEADVDSKNSKANAETINTQQTAVKTDSEAATSQFVNTVNQIQADINKAVDVQTKAPIPVREIISQVIDKARMVITADKSEMIMDLKPESLGKISLKVVTENGIVMAKFVAENQQVKQVLETNMQLLKDSLEKQGLDVQGFSVSVRQDSRNSYNTNNGNNRQGENRRYTAAPMPITSNRLYGDIIETGMMQKNNPYLQESGTINLRA